MKHTVVVVDDHTLLSQAIAGLVNGFENFETSYICNNGHDLLDQLANSKSYPEIVLMDINMPIMNGIETTEYLKKHYPTIKVMALSIEENENTILKMLRAGARGYLMKDTKKDILEEALQQLIEKGYYYTNTISEILVGSLTKKPIEAELNDRELEFIKYACTEMNYKEIAEVMFLATKTVEGYRDSVYVKLHIKNRIGLVLYAIKNHLFIP